MKTQATPKRALNTILALALSAVLVVLVYRAFGMNWAAGIGTVLVVSLWLRAARRSYREQGQDVAPRLIVDRVGELANEERPRLSLRRIRVANAGGRAIQYVELTLVKCGPAPAWFEPVRLQRMQGGAHPFDLPPRSEVYIDFVALPLGHPEIIVVHDSSKHAGLPNGVASQTLALTVQATASGLPSVSVVFEVSRSATGELEVVQKPRS